MPKQLKELRRFQAGTKSAAASSDVQEESAIYSKNIDPISEEGKLRGVKDHVKVLPKDGRLMYCVTPLRHNTGTYDTNWTSSLADASTADLIKDADNNSLLSYPIDFNFKHKGLGPDYYKISLSLPVYADATNTLGFTDAQILKAHNDQYYIHLKTSLEGVSYPNMTVNLARAPKRAGSIYPYPSANTDWSEANQREEFLAQESYGGTVYESGDAVPTEYLPPYRKLSIEFDNTYSKGGVTYDLESIALKIPFTMSSSITMDFYLGDFYGNVAENEIFNPDDNAGTPFKPIEDETPYLPINATEMEMFNDEAKQNVAFYSITENDITFPGYDEEADTGAGTTYRMKVLEDIYNDKEIIDSYDVPGGVEYFDIAGQPADVSLTKKNAHTYIGLGGKETTKSKFFGRMNHKIFNQVVDEYRLLDAEVYPIDDGQSVFNLTQIAFNRHGNTANKAITDEHVYGISDGMMNVFAIDNRDTADPDSDTNTNLGKQFKSTQALTFSPSAITPSIYAYEKNRTLTNGTWTEDSGATTIWNNYTHDAAKSAYWWGADKNRTAVRMFATSFDTTAGGLDITEYTMPINLQCDVAPIAGARITDVIETYDGTDHRVWVLFCKNDYTPFVWEEEFVYSFKVQDIVWGGGTVQAKTHTPPAFKMKKEQSWNLGSGSGNSVYVDGTTMKVDFDSLPYVCYEGTYSCKQNKLYYRNCDDMGNPDGDWNQINGRHWHKYGNYSPHKWDLGKNAGFAENSDYEINPQRYGLTDLGGNHRVGMLAHLKAKHITDAGEINTNRRSKWPKRWYYSYASKNATTEDYDDTMMFFLDPSHKGTKHRRMAAGFNATNGFGNETNADTQAMRTACYAFDANDEYNMMATRFLGSEITTGYVGFNDINTIPEDISTIISSTKYLSNSGTPTYWVSVKGTQGNSTTLQRYQYQYPSRSGTDPLGRSIAQGVAGSNDFSPMIFEYLGTSCFANTSANNGVDEDFFFSPRQGAYIAARSKWNATTGWKDYTGLAELNTAEQGDLKTDKYAHYLLNSELKYGIVLQDGDLTGNENGTFQVGSNYYYKMSVLYDGYQESPMTTFYFSYTPTANCKSVVMTVRLDNPAPRATHIVIYRKNNIEDFYRMVTELDLEKQWGQTGDSWFRVEVDKGSLSATYEAITGMPESLRDTSVNYTISTAAAGYLFVGNCWHKEIKNGQNFIFRSQPGSHSIFNWSRDFIIMPGTPVAMAYWQGRLYVFDKSNMYRVDPNSMVIEDEHAGVGCFGEQSYIVTDFGLYFCDNNNMYLHNGSQVQAIGTDILKNAKLDEQGTIKTNWHNINHAYDPYVAYDAFNQTVKFMFEDVDGTTGSWDFNIPRNRWDLTDIPQPKSYLQGKFGERFLSNGEHFYKLNEDSNNKNWTHYTPALDFGFATIDKKIKKVKLIFNSAADIADANYKIEFLSDEEVIKTVNHPEDNSTVGKFRDEEHEREYKLPKNKTKKLRIQITDCNVEIDSIGITYIQRKVD